jgi:hypothetical protein
MPTFETLTVPSLISFGVVLLFDGVVAALALREFVRLFGWTRELLVEGAPAAVMTISGVLAIVLALVIVL